VQKGQIDGFKTARLLRTIGKDKDQDDYFFEIIKNDLSIADSITFINGQRKKDKVNYDNLSDTELSIIANLNQKLRDVLDTLKGIDKIDNSIAEKMFKQIKDEIKRLNGTKK
jgi:5-bromo-4-chloroindolyl phosphate hydrolysis protein